MLFPAPVALELRSPSDTRLDLRSGVVLVQLPPSAVAFRKKKSNSQKEEIASPAVDRFRRAGGGGGVSALSAAPSRRSRERLANANKLPGATWSLCLWTRVRACVCVSVCALSPGGRLKVSSPDKDAKCGLLTSFSFHQRHESLKIPVHWIRWEI